jgi:O-acetyl-ADP-ribose deacetylase (regulator of RNase III)
MKRLVKNTDVLDEPADTLIYSTNVMLNCTGGVGACLVSRYGAHVQAELHSLLKARGTMYAAQGDVFPYVCSGMPYRKVFHTMPCDGWYETSSEIVERVLRQCLGQCVGTNDVKAVAMSALATGYGHLDFEDFFRVAARTVNDPAYSGIEKITVCIADVPSYQQAVELIRREGLGLEAEPSAGADSDGHGAARP